MIRSFPIFILLNFLLLSPDLLAGGSLHGTVRYQGEVEPPKRQIVSVDQSVCGEVAIDDRLQVGKRGELQNAVVFLEGRIESGKPIVEPSGGFSIDQRGCRFVPPVVIVPAGGMLKVLNSDRLTHRLVFDSRTNPSKTIVQFPATVVSEVRLDSTEIFPLRCDVHRWMEAQIVVAENPYYVLTDEKGLFRLEDIPAGDYNLVIWHQRLGRRVRRVQVQEGERSRIDVSWSLPVDSRYLAKTNFWGNSLTQ